MFASFDPVALDMACADAVNAQPVMPNSMLADKDQCHHDHFTDAHPVTDWKACVDHAEKIGIGTKEYELISSDKILEINKEKTNPRLNHRGYLHTLFIGKPAYIWKAFRYIDKGQSQVFR